MGIVASTAPALAAVASFAGLLVGIEQLTLRARMRRISKWSEELAAKEAAADRLDVLQKLHIWSTSSVVASTVVPSRYFAESVLWAVGGFLFVLVSVLEGTALNIMIPASATLVVAQTFFFRRGVWVMRERHRVAREFQGGQPLSPPRLQSYHRAEFGPRMDFARSLLLSVGINLSALGFALFTKGRLRLLVGAVARHHPAGHLHRVPVHRQRLDLRGRQQRQLVQLRLHPRPDVLLRARAGRGAPVLTTPSR